MQPIHFALPPASSSQLTRLLIKMVKSSITLLAALLAASVAAQRGSRAGTRNRGGAQMAPTPMPEPTTVPGSYIVKLKRGRAGNRAPADVAASAAGGRSRLGRTRGCSSSAFRDYVIVDGADAAAFAALAASADVESIEQDSVVYTAALSLTPLGPGFSASRGSGGSALRGGARSLAVRSGWNAALDRSDARALPLDDSFNSTLDGSGVDMYIFDSGINPAHSEFTGRVATALARNFAADGQSPLTDCLGHGTFVASQAAGSTVGVAFGSRIIPIRVFDCSGAATVSSLLSALDYAIATRAAQGNRASVINFSGSGGASVTMDALAPKAMEAGLLWVDAAGAYSAPILSTVYSVCSTPAV